MPTYDLDVDQPLRRKKKEGGGLGCSIGAWVFFALIAGMVLFVGYRTYFYYQKLKSGQVINLPQFQSHLTTLGERSAIAPVTSIARTDVELATAPSFGPDQKDAKLVIVEFADFQCPYSKEEAMVLRTLMQKYGDKVRFEYRDLPLDEIHQDATQAAVAARCAHEQGKFWAYHDKLYVNSPSLTNQMLTQFAAEIGLDAKQFDACFSSQRYRAAVEADRATAQRLGITGTPTFFLNGGRIEGAIPSDVLEDLILKITQ